MILGGFVAGSCNFDINSLEDVCLTTNWINLMRRVPWPQSPFVRLSELRPRATGARNLLASEPKRIEATPFAPYPSRSYFNEVQRKTSMHPPQKPKLWFCNKVCIGLGIRSAALIPPFA